MRKSSDIEPFTLGRHLDDVPEADERFHPCEVICGLQRLHATRIVHMDLKPENILPPDSGHVPIAKDLQKHTTFVLLPNFRNSKQLMGWKLQDR